jgi:hypothetical protein
MLLSFAYLAFSAGRRHLETVLRIYTTHYNRERPHRALALHPPEPATATPTKHVVAPVGPKNSSAGFGAASSNRAQTVSRRHLVRALPESRIAAHATR